jgi:hypothetical protein
MAKAILLKLILKLDQDADAVFAKIRSDGDESGLLHAKLSVLNDVVSELLRELSTLDKKEVGSGIDISC